MNFSYAKAQDDREKADRAFEAEKAWIAKQFEHRFKLANTIEGNAGAEMVGMAYQLYRYDLLAAHQARLEKRKSVSR